MVTFGSPEHRAKQSESIRKALAKRKQSEIDQWKKNLSDSHIGIEPWNKDLSIKEFKPDSIRKMIATKKKQYADPVFMQKMKDRVYNNAERNRKISEGRMGKNFLTTDQRRLSAIKSYGKKDLRHASHPELIFMLLIERKEGKKYEFNASINDDFVVDFLFDDRKIIVEIDGYWHRHSSKQIRGDDDRKQKLESMGYTVYRLDVNKKNFVEELQSFINNYF